MTFVEAQGCVSESSEEDYSFASYKEALVIHGAIVTRPKHTKSGRRLGESGRSPYSLKARYLKQCRTLITQVSALQEQPVLLEPRQVQWLLLHHHRKCPKLFVSRSLCLLLQFLRFTASLIHFKSFRPQLLSLRLLKINQMRNSCFMKRLLEAVC